MEESKVKVKFVSHTSEPDFKRITIDQMSVNIHKYQSILLLKKDLVVFFWSNIKDIINDSVGNSLPLALIVDEYFL